MLGDGYAEKLSHARPMSKAEKKKRQNEFDLVERVHEAELDRLQGLPEPEHKLTVTLEEDTFTEEKFQVYENYQRIVHQEPPSKITRKGFRNFLCESPIRRRIEVGPGGKEKRLGSYHHCYRLDGKLVGIGVLDLLPHCVSGVYFLYHESLHKFSPGKLSAVREITLALEDGYRYWYPGFYIHSCPKMRYKIDYLPQYMLDPESLQWDLLGPEILALLDKKSFVSYSEEKKRQVNGVADENATEEEKMADPDDEEPLYLFGTDMPGIPSLEEMAKVDMDDIPLRIGGVEGNFKTSDLVIWATQTLSLEGGLKTRIAEFVAAMGPELVGTLCLDFTR